MTYTISDPVGACDIAARLHVTRSTVANWQIRDCGFPRPVFTISNGTRVWEWRAVAEWYTWSRCVR